MPVQNYVLYVKEYNREFPNLYLVAEELYVSLWYMCEKTQ
jgi:hypothetical protein